MQQEEIRLGICNEALSLIGNNNVLKSLEEPYKSVEARSCARWFPSCFSECLSKGQWSFARRDEVLTDDYLTDFTSLPWKHTYRLPDDVGHIYSIAYANASSKIESIGTVRGYGRFAIRNIDAGRYLATDLEPGFVINYQANNVDLSVCPPIFISAVRYLLASRLASEFLKSDIGLTHNLKFIEMSNTELIAAMYEDAAQGSYSQRNEAIPMSIKSRW